MSYIEGAILGYITGDALGHPWYKTNPSIASDNLIMKKGPGDELPGEYTSHSAFMLATVNSLIENKSLDTEDLMEKMYETYIGGYLTSDGNCYDVSPSNSNAILNYSNGMPVDRCLSDSFDSGCLSRILPVALFYSSKSTDILIENVEKCCLLTNSSIISKVVCSIYALALRNILLQKNEKVTDILFEYYKKHDKKVHGEHLIYHLENSLNSDIPDISREFWQAWKCFRENQQSSEKSISCAIHSTRNHRVAGLVGSLVGISHGVKGMPSIWIKELRITPTVQNIINQFKNLIN